MSPFDFTDLLAPEPFDADPPFVKPVDVPEGATVPGNTQRVLMSAPALDEEGEYEGSARFEAADLEHAHIATSIVAGEKHWPMKGFAGNYHAPLLDLDIPHHLVELETSRWATDDEPEFVTLYMDVADAFIQMPDLEDVPAWVLGNNRTRLQSVQFQRDINVLNHRLQEHDLGTVDWRGTYRSDALVLIWTLRADRTTLVPTSTPGHSHLYLDAKIPFLPYARLLVALARVGIVEPGFARAAIHREHSAGRLPWIKKGSLILQSEFKPEPTEPITLEEFENWAAQRNAEIDPRMTGWGG